MSDLLGIGLSGVTAYRTALGAVGENVANAETPGYSRRTVRLREAPSGAGTSDIVHRDAVLFGGVEVAAIERAWDSFRATEARHAASAAGRSDVREQWLTGIETALADGPAGIGGSLTAFFASATTLAGEPGDPLGRSAMLTALGDVASAFRTTAAALGRISTGIGEAARIDVAGLNGDLAALHKLNGSIRIAAPGGTARAAMEDERDRLVSAIAARIGVEAEIAGDGTVALTSSGSSAALLLDGAGPALVSMATAPDGRLSFQIDKAGTAMPLPIAGGSIAGLAETATAAADRRAGLDLLAADFAGALNAWSAAGLDGNGAPGGPLLDGAGGAAVLGLAISDPAQIAAASTDGRANGNLLALDALRGPGRFEARWSTIVSGNAQAVASARSEAAAAATWRDQSHAALDEIGGIDLDREAADLLRYQQAYSGATRILQVARETLDDILKLF